MKFPKIMAIAACAGMAICTLQTESVEARPGEYIYLPVSTSISSAKGGVLAQSRFYQGNWLRGELGPHQYAVFYRPDYRYAPRRTKYWKKRKYRRRR